VVLPDGIEFARGLVAYNSTDAKRIAGLKSADIQKLLGNDDRDVIIHRDDLVMMGGERN
jgi:glutamate 5-kinase